MLLNFLYINGFILEIDYGLIEPGLKLVNKPDEVGLTGLIFYYYKNMQSSNNNLNVYSGNLLGRKRLCLRKIEEPITNLVKKVNDAGNSLALLEEVGFAAPILIKEQIIAKKTIKEVEVFTASANYHKQIDIARCRICEEMLTANSYFKNERKNCTEGYTCKDCLHLCEPEDRFTKVIDTKIDKIIAKNEQLSKIVDAVGEERRRLERTYYHICYLLIAKTRFEFDTNDRLTGPDGGEITISHQTFNCSEDIYYFNQFLKGTVFTYRLKVEELKRLNSGEEPVLFTTEENLALKRALIKKIDQANSIVYLERRSKFFY